MNSESVFNLRYGGEEWHIAGDDHSSCSKMKRKANLGKNAPAKFCAGVETYLDT